MKMQAEIENFTREVGSIEKETLIQKNVAGETRGRGLHHMHPRY